MSLLSVRDLNVWFEPDGGGRVHAVRSVDFGLDPGERLALVGESGCGKTTTILAMLGLLPPHAAVSGAVRLNGVDLLAQGERSARPHRWTDIAMVFQGAMNALNPVRRIGWQLTEPLRVHRIAAGPAARDRVQELLAMVGLPAEAAERYPHELSGGQRQRAVIALALACEPKVLLADEPTTALDVMVQAQVLGLLRELTERLGLALVLVTHDLQMVPEVCDRIAVMYAGAVVEQGPCRTVLGDARHPYTRRLVAATPNLNASRPLESIPGAPPRLDEPLVGCPFRPRCDVAVEICGTVEPSLAADEAGRACACHVASAVALIPGEAR